jgi:hypothetical protein
MDVCFVLSYVGRGRVSIPLPPEIWISNTRFMGSGKTRKPRFIMGYVTSGDGDSQNFYLIASRSLRVSLSNKSQFTNLNSGLLVKYIN